MDEQLVNNMDPYAGGDITDEQLFMRRFCSSHYLFRILIYISCRLFEPWECFFFAKCETFSFLRKQNYNNIHDAKWLYYFDDWICEH